MSADSIRLPKAFASSGDPVDENPFAPENPRHVAWSEATRVAELEACDLAMRKMSLVSSFADFMEHPFSPREWLVAPVVEEFDIWAKRGVHVVWSDLEVRLFDDWLVTYANALMDTLTGFLKRNPPPFDADAQLTDARNRLGARVQYWRGEARRYRDQQRAAALMDASDKGTPAVTPEMKERRQRVVVKYRKEHDLSAIAFARRVGVSETAVRGIVNEDRSRFSDETQARLLKVLTMTRHEWYRA